MIMIINKIISSLITLGEEMVFNPNNLPQIRLFIVAFLLATKAYSNWFVCIYL